MVTPAQLFQREIEYGLIGGAALGQLMAPDDQQHVRALDEGNAFTSLETPPWMWPLLSGPLVLAGELPPAWVAGRWSAKTRLRPQYRRLPMGNTHASLILIAVNQEAADLALR